MPPAQTPLSKTALRDQLLTARNRRSLADVGAAGRALADAVMALPEIRRAGTVAAYVSMGTEPGTGELLTRLLEARKRVLLPRLLPDNDLDWVRHDGDLEPARRGLLEPPGPGEGVDAIGWADVVLVPALAVSRRTGVRLGRGGGSYDRALARVPVGTPVLALLYDDELVDDVPADPWDRAVTGVLTPRQAPA